MAMRVSLRPKKRPLVGKLIRLTAFLLVVGVASFAFLAYQTVANARRALSSFGETLITFYGEDAPPGPARALVVNGQALSFVTGTTDKSVDQVLDFYQARCRSRDGRFSDQLGELQRAGAVFPDVDDGLLDGTMRDDNGQKGFVACFDMGPEAVPVAELTRRISEFAESGDVSRIGRFRYMFVEKGQQKTRFFAMWVDGELNIKQMFPEKGDAPGDDPAAVPRPPEAKRLLSSFEDGFPQRFYVYEGSNLDPAGLESYYRDRLPGEGWTLLEGERAARAPDGTPTLVAERGPAEMAVLTFTKDEAGRGMTTVLIAR